MNCFMFSVSDEFGDTVLVLDGTIDSVDDYHLLKALRIILESYARFPRNTTKFKISLAYYQGDKW